MIKKQQKKLKIAGFIKVLVDILQNKSNEQVIIYNQDQRTFSIKNVRRFTEEILTKYFKHRNYSSFIRQLNLYDFHKVRLEGKQEVFYHQSLIINDLKSLRKLKRKKMSSQKCKNTKKVNKIYAQSCSDSQYIDQQQQQDDQENSKNQHQHQNVKSSQRSSLSSTKIQQLQRRKAQLQKQIRIEQMSNQKLTEQNNYLRDTFYTENHQFYKEILKLLQNLILSQFHQGFISKQTYDNMMIYVFDEKKKFLKEYNNNISYINTSIHNNSNYSNKNFIPAKQYQTNQISQTPHAQMFKQFQSENKYQHIYKQSQKQSKLFTLIKQILYRKKQNISIQQFIIIIKEYIEKRQNHNHPAIDILKQKCIRPVVNYCFPIVEMEEESHFNAIKNQKNLINQKNQKIDKDQLENSNKEIKHINQIIRPNSCEKIQEKNNQQYQNIKIKKKHKKSKHQSDDEDYNPLVKRRK